MPIDAKIVLTEKRIRELSANPERLNWVNDQKADGLSLAVRESGRKVFYYRKRHGSRIINRKLGDWSDSAEAAEKFFKDPLNSIYKGAVLTLEAARALTTALTAAYSAGLDPFAEKTRHTSHEMTVAECFELYMRDHYEGARKRVDDVRKDFARDCLQPLGALPLSAVDGLMARTFHQRLTATRGAYTANRRVQLMRAMFNKARRWKYLTGDNPFSEVTLNPEKEREYALTEAQAAALWSALSEDGNSLMRDWGRLLMLTGARKSELCAMRWDMVDLGAGTWLIPDSKSGESRTIALGDLELEILKARAKESEWVFPSPDGRTHVRDPKKSWDTVRRRAGVPDCTMHDARRSLATLMANAGADAKTIQKTLGHKDIKTTLKHYRYSGQDQQRQAKAAATAGFLKRATKDHDSHEERVE